MKIIYFILLLILSVYSQQIKRYDPCDAQLDTQIGDRCFNETELAQCNQNLNNLDGQETNNTSVTNECTPYIQDGQQAYNFTLSFLNGFEPDLFCLDFNVTFENDKLDEGNSIFNEWVYDSQKNQIHFNISHERMEESGECEFKDENGQYVWICEMKLEILLGGDVQLEYDFKIQVIITREVSANNESSEDGGEELIVNVVENLVEGVCCENELQIQTGLRFCTNFTCQEFLPSPLSIQRGQEFVVEHYIISEEFQDYHLQGQQIKIGPYFAEIIEEEVSETGSYRWKVKGNIAIQDQVIESISKIHKESQTLRLLGEIRDNYQVKGVSFISVLDQEQMRIEAESREKQKIILQNKAVQNEQFIQNTGVIVSTIIVSFLVILTVIGARLYCVKEKRHMEMTQRKLQLDQQSKNNVQRLSIQMSYNGDGQVQQQDLKIQEEQQQQQQLQQNSFSFMGESQQKIKGSLDELDKSRVSSGLDVTKININFK